MRKTFLIFTFLILAVTSMNAYDAEAYRTTLDSLSRETLTQYALGAEKYANIKSGRGIRYGGLHDYIRLYTEDQIKDTIVNFVSQYPELSENSLLENFSSSNVLSTESVIVSLESKDINELYAIALACEQYSRKKSGQEDLLGGLHDYLYSLDKSETINIISDFIKSNPELAIKDKLDEITNVAQLVTSTSATRLGGLEDYIFNFSRYELVQMALAGETYDRDQKGEMIFGGLHDYIRKMNEYEIMQAILKYTKQYPALAVPGKLESLAGIQKFGFIYQLNSNDVPVTDSKLKEYCLAVDSIYAKDNNILGGIHDYINTLTRDDLLKYLKRMSNLYPQITEKGGLDKMLEQANASSESEEETNDSLEFLH